MTKRKVVKCNHCGMDIAIRNPSGYCDHLHYPENCKTCKEYHMPPQKKLPTGLKHGKPVYDTLETIIYEHYRLAWSKGEFPDGLEVTSKIVADKVMEWIASQLPKEKEVEKNKYNLEEGARMYDYTRGWNNALDATKQALLGKER